MRRDWATWVLLMVAFVLGICFSGCQPEWAKADQASDAAAYSDLPLASRSQHAPLRDELARLTVERATPTLMMETTTQPVGADSSDITRDLVAIFPRDRLAALVAASTEVMPRERLLGEPAQTHRLREFRQRHDGQLAKARVLLGKPNARLSIDLREGLAADASFVEAAIIVARLEICSAAEALAFDESHAPDNVLPALENLARWCELLSHVPHVPSRLAAGELRRSELLVLAAIVQHPQATRATQQRALNLLQGQVDRWPDDALAWRGDRAAGLHAYDMVRDGHLLSLLTLDEIKVIRGKSSVTATLAAVRDNIDRDEQFYLETMRHIIDGCREPYCRNAEKLRELELQCRAQANTPELPYVAVKLLLGDFMEGRRQQAADRSRVALWVMALREALEYAREGTVREGESSDSETGQSFGNRSVLGKSGKSTRVVITRPGDTAVVPILAP